MYHTDLMTVHGVKDGDERPNLIDHPVVGALLFLPLSYKPHML